MYTIVRVDRRIAEAIEPLGTKNKFWFTSPDGARTLFKAEERGTGEDWAEKIACELCVLLGLPHVHYELALEVEGQTPGVICASCVSSNQPLAHGNQLLVAADPNYPQDLRRFKVAAYSVQAVAGVLRNLRPPSDQWLNGAPPHMSALDFFTGYLMLDAWVANQDRHHENWAAIRAGEAMSLAPTFDHGASLARNLGDKERHERLTSRDQNYQVGAFARRARSALYADAAEPRPLTTVAAWRAFADLTPIAAEVWLKRLEALEPTAIHEIVEQIPPQRLSAVGREFTIYLLEENRRRLLEGNRE
ncbi:MAG: hypothetical protein AMXMBFR20_33440 [Planctomycetia bacterium]